MLHIRLYPTDDDAIPEYLVVETRGRVDDLGLQWENTPLARAVRDEVGWIFSTQLAEDPDDRLREVRQLLGISKWLALQRPHDWVQVWDEDGLVAALLGSSPSFYGGVVTGDDGYDDAGETIVAEEVAKCVLPGLDLGFPPGLPSEVLDALDRGVGARGTDPDFVALLVAAVNRSSKLRRTSAVELLCNLFDDVDAGALRGAILSGFQNHSAPVRRELARLLEYRTEPAEAQRLALDLVFSSPKNEALDDAAAALRPFLEHPDVVSDLEGAVAPDGPPRPGSRVEAVAADLLIRRPGGHLVVARRARADREGEPMFWWALRKLLANPHDDTLPTIALFARSPRRPSWVDDAVSEARLTLPAGDEATLLARERQILG